VLSCRAGYKSFLARSRTCRLSGDFDLQMTIRKYLTKGNENCNSGQEESNLL